MATFLSQLRRGVRELLDRITLNLPAVDWLAALQMNYGLAKAAPGQVELNLFPSSQLELVGDSWDLSVQRLHIASWPA